MMMTFADRVVRQRLSQRQRQKQRQNVSDSDREASGDGDGEVVVSIVSFGHRCWASFVWRSRRRQRRSQSGPRNAYATDILCTIQLITSCAISIAATTLFPLLLLPSSILALFPRIAILFYRCIGV